MKDAAYHRGCVLLAVYVAAAWAFMQYEVARSFRW